MQEKTCLKLPTFISICLVLLQKIQTLFLSESYSLPFGKFRLFCDPIYFKFYESNKCALLAVKKDSI